MQVEKRFAPVGALSFLATPHIAYLTFSGVSESRCWPGSAICAESCGFAECSDSGSSLSALGSLAGWGRDTSPGKWRFLPGRSWAWHSHDAPFPGSSL